MEENSKSVLTESQVAAFNERGYLVADFSLNESMLDAIVEKVQPLYPEDYQQNPTLPARVQDAWKSIDEVRQLARDMSIAQALQQLVGRQSLPFQTLNFPIGTRQFTHSDTVHFNSIPSNYMAGVWVALEDIDEDNGPLLYYPGSHKLHEYSMHDFRSRAGLSQLSQIRRMYSEGCREGAVARGVRCYQEGRGANLARQFTAWGCAAERSDANTALTGNSLLFCRLQILHAHEQHRRSVEFSRALLDSRQRRLPAA